jgi:protein-disulfide isomerase
VLSAQAAECVADQGQFWVYHDRLFAEQAQLDEAQLTLLAQELGVNMEQFNTCLADKLSETEVLADYQAGQDLGLSGAPVIFINGIRLQGAHPYDEIAEVIEQELE